MLKEIKTVNLLNIIVLEHDYIIYQVLKDFANSNNIICCKNNSDIDSLIREVNKIHLLIIDSDELDYQRLVKISYAIINLTNNYIPNAFLCEKPFKLQFLLDKICLIYYKKKIFSVINNKFLYDEEKAILYYNQKTISLTEKENILLSILLLADNYYHTKDNIKKLIYYSNNIDDFVIDSLALRLKQKMPLLYCYNNGYTLNIENIK